MKYNFEILTNSKEETIELGTFIAKYLKVGNIILLKGDLGAGKTTFTQGVATGLGIVEKVISPTFNILKCYFNKKLNLYHIDAYRLENANKNIGLEEFIEGDGACIIEWPNYIEEFIPIDTMTIELYHVENDIRKLIFSSDSDDYKEIFEGLKNRNV